MPTVCPWCGFLVVPVRTDPFKAVSHHKHESLKEAIRLNPLMCPKCCGVGGTVDFAPAPTPPR